MHPGFWRRNLKERAHLKELDIDTWKIRVLELVVKKQVGMACTGLI
jgi:hypothetical protein